MMLKMIGFLIWTVLLIVATGGMYVNRNNYELPIVVQWAMAGIFVLSLVMLEVFAW